MRVLKHLNILYILKTEVSETLQILGRLQTQIQAR